jgi:heptosyltransferase-1
MFTTARGERGKTGPQILVVRIGSMGDVIHALPAVATLKHSFPGSTLTWVIHPRWSLLLDRNPFVDEMIRFDRRKAGSLADAWRALRIKRYDFAVDFQGLIQSALIASVARCDRIYGFHQSQVRERLAALFYSNRVRSTQRHVVDRNLELAAAAGASTMLVKFPLPEGVPEGELPEGRFVLSNPQAGWGAKQWPIEHYRTLARRLRGELGVPLVLNGPHGSQELLGSVPDAMVNISGVPGLIHATRRAAVVLGCDSGPMHLAAALDKPGVAIYGPTDPARNGPYGRAFTVLRSPDAVTSHKRRPATDASMEKITPDQVFEALKARLCSQSKSAGSGI